MADEGPARAPVVTRLADRTSGPADADAVHAAPGSRRATRVRASTRLSPDGYPLFLVVAELDDGGSLEWGDVHGDDGVHVLAGALDVDGRMCPTGGALVVESGVACTARAVGPTHVVHCGAVDPEPPADGLYGPPGPAGHGVHVVGDGGRFASGDRERVDVRWFADSTCPTCRIALFVVRRAEGGVRDRSHTHTQDELILVLDGSLLVAGEEHGAGTCLAIPARTRYSLTSGPDGFTILNVRRDVSVQAYRPGEPEELEGALARGGRVVDDLR
jgi:hypothetical protein